MSTRASRPRVHNGIIPPYRKSGGKAPAFMSGESSGYRLVEGDTELLPRLELVESSGHVPGHQSVLVCLPKTGAVLLTIDAVPQQRSFTPEREAGPLDMDEEMLRASTHKLLELAQREQVSLVVFGHDGEQWQTLKKAPDWYD